MVETIMEVSQDFYETFSETEEFIPFNKAPLFLGLEHPSVKKVVEIAVEITKENKIITTELLYNRAKKRLKIPRKGLKKIIQILMDRNILVDGSKLTKPTILKNKTRSIIYQLIKRYIGAHFSFLKEMFIIQKKYEIGVGQLIWHLEKLLEFNLIKKVKVKNSIIYLPIDIDDNVGIVYFFLRDKINRRIVSVILEREMINKSEINDQLELKREKLYYRIKNLIKFDILALLMEDESCIVINPNRKKLITDVMDNFLANNQIIEQNQLISIKI